MTNVNICRQHGQVQVLQPWSVMSLPLVFMAAVTVNELTEKDESDEQSAALAFGGSIISSLPPSTYKLWLSWHQISPHLIIWWTGPYASCSVCVCVCVYRYRLKEQRLVVHFVSLAETTCVSFKFEAILGCLRQSEPEFYLQVQANQFSGFPIQENRRNTVIINRSCLLPLRWNIVVVFFQDGDRCQVEVSQ